MEALRSVSVDDFEQPRHFGSEDRGTQDRRNLVILGP